MKKLKQLSGAKLILACAVVLCLVWLGKNLLGFGYEAVSRANGSMETFTLYADDFELIGIVKNEDGSYKSTDWDPQMVLVRDMKVARITIDGTFSISPGEMLAYYTQKEGQGFAAEKRYWFYADEGSDTAYTASMPLKNLKSVRIDPTTFAGNTMEINSITFNAPKSFVQYFAVDASHIFKLMVYSCLIGAAITMIKEFFEDKKTKN